MIFITVILLESVLSLLTEFKVDLRGLTDMDFSFSYLLHVIRYLPVSRSGTKSALTLLVIFNITCDGKYRQQKCPLVFFSSRQKQ